MKEKLKCSICKKVVGEINKESYIATDEEYVGYSIFCSDKCGDKK